jgi:hypothetical protein
MAIPNPPEMARIAPPKDYSPYARKQSGISIFEFIVTQEDGEVELSGRVEISGRWN